VGERKKTSLVLPASNQDEKKIKRSRELRKKRALRRKGSEKETQRVPERGRFVGKNKDVIQRSDISGGGLLG